MQIIATKKISKLASRIPWATISLKKSKKKSEFFFQIFFWIFFFSDYFKSEKNQDFFFRIFLDGHSYCLHLHTFYSCQYSSTWSKNRLILKSVKNKYFFSFQINPGGPLFCHEKNMTKFEVLGIEIKEKTINFNLLV